MRVGAKLRQMKIPIALQLYSVRNECAKDLLGVIRAVAKMGYEGVEFAGYHGHSPAEIKATLDDAGIKTEGTHTGIDQLSDENFNKTVDLHKTLDTTYVIVPWIPEEMRNSPDSCKATAERLTALTEKLAGAGLRLGFHAHEGDMRPLTGGKSAWDLLAGGTPDSFIMQYDTANGMAGGADPVQPILDWPGRSESVHLKEYKGGHGKAVIGDGDVPWQRLFHACETVGGTKWYVVEHEDDFSPSPLDAVDRCLKNLRRMGK
jgi:sugar phosphate isomerase/epimerase